MPVYTLQIALLLLTAYLLGALVAGRLRRWLHAGEVSARLPRDRDLSFAAVVTEGFLARLGFSIVTFALPFYALSLGMSLSEIGLLAAMRSIIALAVKPLVGLATDRLGVKAVYVGSIAVRGVVGLLFMLATEPWELFAIRALHGVSTAARDPTSALLIAVGTDSSRLARAFSWYATAKVAGASLGFSSAGLLLTLTADNFRLVFLIAAVTSLLAWLLVLRLVRFPPMASLAADAAFDEETKLPSRRPQWLEYAGLAMLISIPASMLNGLFPVIASQWSGLSKAEVGTVYALSTVIVIVAGPLLGWAADRFSVGIVLSIRSLANMLSSILYVAVPGLWGLAAARFADDFGKAGYKPAWGAMMSEVARANAPGQRGRVISYLDTAESAGEAIGPVLAGLLWDHSGIVWMFAARIGLSLLAELYAVLLLFGRARRAPQT